MSSTGTSSRGRSVSSQMRRGHAGPPDETGDGRRATGDGRRATGDGRACACSRTDRGRAPTDGESRGSRSPRLLTVIRSTKQEPDCVPAVCHEYGVDLPRGLPVGNGKPTKEFPTEIVNSAHRARPQIHQVRPGGDVVRPCFREPAAVRRTYRDCWGPPCRCCRWAFLSGLDSARLQHFRCGSGRRCRG